MSAFDKIIGYDKIKTELMQISDMIHRPDAYAALGARMPKGLLLDGEPGLGKTLMAMALMEDSGLPCFTVRRCRSEEGFLKTLEETFGKAADAAPSMILLDDMDKFSSDEFSTAEFTAVQGCMDNDADTLPDSLLRCGRFDRQIIVHRPDTEDAEEIIRHYLERQVAAPDIAISDLAMLLVHSSCAELESALNEAAVYAAYDRSSTISAAHFIRAVLTTVHHVSPDISDADKEDQEASARHEAGHIAVMELLAPGSVAFATLCMSRLLHGFSCKADHPVLFTSEFFNNKFGLLAFAAGMVLINLVLWVPGLHGLFQIADLSGALIAAMYGLSLASMLAVQVVKAIVYGVSDRKKKQTK